MKCRRKPLVFEYWIFDHTKELPPGVDCVCSSKGYAAWIDTLEGRMSVVDGDYIIKGVNGETWPCKADIFEKTYDRIDK